MKSHVKNEQKTNRELELEDVNGHAALMWVSKQNQEVMSKLLPSPAFKKIEKAALDILEDKRRISTIKIRDGYAYEFWHDKNHAQGIWRRTKFKDYKKPSCQWDTLLDIDHLPEKNYWESLTKKPNNSKSASEHWVYESVTISPNNKTAMVELSLGGKDGVVYREFDINKKKFVKGGFYIKEDDIFHGWFDNNSILINDYTDKDYDPALGG